MAGSTSTLTDPVSGRVYVQGSHVVTAAHRSAQALDDQGDSLLHLHLAFVCVFDGVGDYASSLCSMLC